MDFNKILSTVFNTAKQSAENIKKPSESTADTIAKVGGGAALAGLLSMVLGKNGGKNLTKMGGLAVLGSLAYKAYQNYQKNQSSSTELTENQFESTDHSQEEKSAILLRTMIAAALSDGEISEAERTVLAQECHDDVELQRWIKSETENPISVNEIGRIVGNDIALASQVYLAARVVCQDLSRKEIIFLSQLAAALKLDDALVEQLEKQAGY